MSTGRSNAVDALPRASFLTYFRTSSQPERRTSEYCQRGRTPCRTHCSRAPLLPRIPEDAITEENADEESRLGNCEHFDHCENGEQNENEKEWEWSDILSFIGYTLLVLLIVLNLNFLLSAYRSNAGLMKWDGWGVDGSSSGREMHFCLAEQNRLAPTSRVWRYVPRDSYSGCTTRILTIHADPTEEHKLFTEDIIAGKAAL
ncbi:uncharacterized protein N0V89_007167 [Didymosphaeria variabile]|uniref:Uncharacterized protein n=1 Tax=Didymosphaeria variabile TaxID=1932322 RepID=A0A9W8XID4_9PLEO|nr:uncharacterized protein N0V89_007167 [Didymosphaeria variabile]KAJ4351823.1 hypothetical protein N0V89_007167 [Didymosphaeria variabile]